MSFVGIGVWLSQGLICPSIVTPCWSMEEEISWEGVFFWGGGINKESGCMEGA